MDSREWLRSRRAAPPARLASRIADAITDVAGTSRASPSESLADAGVAILDRLTGLAREETPRRQVALDLLAADALVTYALEAATEECESLAATADALIARLASLASAREA